MNAPTFATLDRQRYDWLRVIGRGQGTCVWLTRDKEEEKPKAIRVIDREWISETNEGTLGGVRNLLELLSVYTCKFLASCDGMFSDSIAEYYVHEYCPGGELLTYARSEKTGSPLGTLSLDVTMFYMGQVLLALSHCHKNQILYRDLRPESMLLTEQGNLKLADPFMAKRVHARTYSIVGKPEYMAPEIVQNCDGYTTAVDWWSFGVVTFELLQGYPPFYSESPMKTIELANAAVVTYPNTFDTTSVEFISSLLVPDPVKRLGSHKRGIDDIKKHKFFTAIEWDQLITQSLSPPIVPKLKSDFDYSSFDEFPFASTEEQKRAASAKEFFKKFNT